MTQTGSSAPELRGQRGVVHWARRYDLLISLITLGRERALRERILDRVPIASGAAVLDIGCGTGTLAIAATRRTGTAGRVYGIDASPQMVARARRKARRADVRAEFAVSRAEALPFPDGSIDVVLSTVMLHHLPRRLRAVCLSEVARVLAPDGTVLVVDFGTGAGRQRGIFAHFHRHGRLPLADLVTLQSDAGLEVLDSGSLGIGALLFVLGRRPSTARSPHVSDQPRPL